MTIANQWLDNVVVLTTTVGTGAMVLGALPVTTPPTNSQTEVAAGAVNNSVLTYRIDDGTAWEIGYGTYTAASRTLTRTPLWSSNGNAAINLDGGGVVKIVLIAEDMSTATGFLPLTGGTLSPGGLTVNNLSGNAISVSPASNNAIIGLNKPTATNWNQIQGFMNGSPRWYMALGTNEAETGGSAGSNFGLYNFSDAGSQIGTPLSINRSTGNATFGGTITAAGATLTGALNINYANANLFLNGTSGNQRSIDFMTGGVDRWRIFANQTSETGANAGSDFNIANFADNGSYINTPISINRNTGAVTFNTPVYFNYGGPSSALNCNGSAAFSGGVGVGTGSPLNCTVFSCTTCTCQNQMCAGWSPAGQPPSGIGGYVTAGYYQSGAWYNAEKAAASSGGNQGLFYYNNGNSYIYWSATSSDRRRKSNLKAAGDALAIVNKLPIYDLDFTPNVKPTVDDMPEAQTEHWPFSLIADEVADVMPHAGMKGAGDDSDLWVGMHPQHLIAVLWKAVQQLSAEVEALKAG